MKLRGGGSEWRIKAQQILGGRSSRGMVGAEREKFENLGSIDRRK